MIPCPGALVVFMESTLAEWQQQGRDAGPSENTVVTYLDAVAKCARLARGTGFYIASVTGVFDTSMFLQEQCMQPVRCPSLRARVVQ